MSNFTANVIHQTEFDGDRVTVSIKRARRKDMQLLSPCMRQDKEGNIKVTLDDSLGFMEIAEKIFPDRIESLSGLTDKSGLTLGVDDMLGASYFLPLITDIMTAFINGSIFREEETVKKSEDMSVDQQPATEEPKKKASFPLQG